MLLLKIGEEKTFSDIWHVHLFSKVNFIVL